MATILIVIHLLIAVSLVATVLLQRSEGGALGIGGGGGGGMVSNRAAGNALTRATAVLAALFFATSIGLTLLAQAEKQGSSILEQVPAGVSEEPVEAPETPVPGVPSADEAGEGAAAPAAPVSEEPQVPSAD
ncbi:preprotein translocase SecG subunit [Tepidicaulis marinus]|uniref:Protein-export membrane protein SecG n=1 Tax=Tepidicaulis marinus TaxID=1333998 RepID=A0A081B8Z3_9HYPH|nr:preprotein translocase subunit SecG [Tepidicaulis marinus]GAK44511.1 preprotein translocase SecG subunit [Tepidicaulis marinus]